MLLAVLGLVLLFLAGTHVETQRAYMYISMRVVRWSSLGRQGKFSDGLKGFELRASAVNLFLGDCFTWNRVFVKEMRR